MDGVLLLTGLVVGIGALGLLAGCYGADTRERVRSHEEELARMGMQWERSRDGQQPVAPANRRPSGEPSVPRARRAAVPAASAARLASAE